MSNVWGRVEPNSDVKIVRKGSSCINCVITSHILPGMC